MLSLHLCAANWPLMGRCLRSAGCSSANAQQSVVRLSSKQQLEAI
jgi:hypothetical protein